MLDAQLTFNCYAFDFKFDGGLYLAVHDINTNEVVIEPNFCINCLFVTTFWSLDSGQSFINFLTFSSFYCTILLALVCRDLLFAAGLVSRLQVLPKLLIIQDFFYGQHLRKLCGFFLQDIAIRNLDYIFTVSGHAIANTSLDVLVMLEKVWDMKSSEPWSYRRLPTPTAPFPAIIDSEEDNEKIEALRTRGNCTSRPILRQVRDQRLDNFLQSDEIKEGVLKQVRALRKKLQQIEMLEDKRFKGQTLDNQQIAKLQTKSALEMSLAELGAPVERVQSTVSSSVLADGKGSNKVDVVPKKQSRKSKQKAAPIEVASSQCESAESSPRKGASSVQIPEVQYEVRFYPFCICSIPWCGGQ